MELTTYTDYKKLDKDLNKIRDLKNVTFNGVPLDSKMESKLVDAGYALLERYADEVLQYSNTEVEVVDELQALYYDPKKQLFVAKFSLEEIRPASIYSAEVGGTNEDFELSPSEVVDYHEGYVHIDSKLKAKDYSFKEPRNVAVLFE